MRGWGWASVTHKTALLRTIEKSGLANQVWPQQSKKYFLKVTRKRQNYCPYETYPYIQVNRFCCHIKFQSSIFKFKILLKLGCFVLY